MDPGLEQAILNKYNLSTLWPTRWPDEKNDDSDSDAEAPPAAAAQPVRRSRSRYSILEDRSRFSRQVPGAEISKDGKENLVQKDEQDPLGMYPSVVQVLRSRSVQVEDDIKLRNRFLLSSTTFSPQLFLSQVHSDASTDMLLAGLEYLSNSIEKKSASLKVLVESNFERFVGAKATIDRVYTEMREQGKEAESPSRSQHSRVGSRSSFSGRKVSDTLTPGIKTPAEKRKNALIKESEYGVHGIKVPLTEVAAKAEEVWGPALNGREKEETLKAIQEAVDQHRGLFEVASALQEAIRRKDHESIVEEYKRARKYAEDARAIAEQAAASRSPLPDAKLHQVIVTARMWAEVERLIEDFKRDSWKRLANTHFTKLQTGTDETRSDQYMSIISIMLELGVEDNPIWIWLLSRYDHLKSRLNSSCERSRVELEVLRRHLANGEKPSLRQQQKHLRAVPMSSTMSVEPSKLDSPKVVEFWEHCYASMNTILSNRGGLVGELIEYWEITQSFISGRAQRNLPTGYQNQSSVHHKLTDENKIELEKGTTELIGIVREHLISFFSDPPLEDVSLLFSPLPTSPTPTTPRTPLSAALSPTSGSRFRFDPNNMPPPSPNRGESWEKYAFWPPHANALSGSHYLSKTLVLVGTAANELASLRLTETGAAPRLHEELRSLLGSVRERCAQAVCAAWNTDAEKLKVLEDWTRNPDRKDTTNLPQRFMAVQTFLLNNLQKTLYVEPSTKTSVDVVVPPSSKLLQMVRSQFVTSLYRTLSGMVECAEKGRKAIGEDFEVRGDDITVDPREMEEDGWGKVDSNNKSIRLLLTLSNMSAFQSSISPSLLSLFETLFSVQLTDESNRIRDVLSQLDAQLFLSYTKPHATKIAQTIESGVFSPTWAPPPPPGKGVADRDPSPFVFSVLLDLVIVHTESSTTSYPLTPRILRSLFESTTQSLIATFRSPNLAAISLPQLMQATLDVEFMAQTLASYTTEVASQVQTDIYQVLDAKTDNAARVRLQDELGGLRSTLKRLREGTKVQFACFRRVKREGR
ncbi:exocyst complex component SEC5 [Parastagonospora nodorum]|uniref:Exocyst complex component SEC5 n=1 Tax=Phaeosphaeria nodorum (strain SN15 / ATCC MYA-4574 / FGSC 10173) TaxID=321614 RepID=A0A7U2I9W7_PHANO|nr:exocyst complex component SEC5 [Parastagonospora nodorum]QRD05921.1 exocyst complex component SEC5 [Parastagonospora nodorum SN15]KAH3931490.1 exocyst complex component SEC5 [Parastagonospora nodorum]KAH3944372.1 exocyst complex component SEC5 [Parastagonospora nodorum]KAH3960697.1 exocyst complex component SEC5 [Parastagonospora nodorum]